MKIALIHDWLTGMRGGEKVLEVLCELFPDAPLYTLLHNRGAMSACIERMDIRTSFLQRLPFISTQYRKYLPLMPKAIESFDLHEYDLILSTSSAVAKGARPSSKAIHLCYCHSPMRYVWDQYDDYFGKGRAGVFTRIAIALFVSYLRRWDVDSSTRVTQFIANSHNVAERISRIYHRSSDVIYPPVNTDLFTVSEKDEGYYLIVSALVPYKRVDLAIDVFNTTGDRLLVVGIGPELNDLQSRAGAHIEFLGWQSDTRLAELYAGCTALIFPGVEDFGIVPLEAMASGKPVIAFAKGGALETVVAGGESPTGILFYEQTTASLHAAIQTLQTTPFDPFAIRKHAEQFDVAVFKQTLHTYIQQKIEERL